MQSAAKKYVSLALGLSGAAILFIGGLNYGVDPYNRFGRNRLGVYISAEREFKSVEVRRYPHDAVLIGNSRINIIPVGQLRGYRFFNASFAHASTEEIYYFIDRFVHDQKLLILGADTCEGDPPELQGDIFAPQGWDAALDNLLSLRTAEYSIRTIFMHWKGEPPDLSPDGSGETTRWFRLYDRDDPAFLKWELARLRTEASRTKAPGIERMRFYRKIADCLRARGVTCVVMVPPLNAAVAASVPAEAYQQWRRDLDSIFPHVVDLSHSRYGAEENFFKRDPVHFKPLPGVEMINNEVIPLALRLTGASAQSTP
jgi:hypothetical protein